MGEREKNIGQIRNLTAFSLSFARSLKELHFSVLCACGMGRPELVYILFLSPPPTLYSVRCSLLAQNGDQTGNEDYLSKSMGISGMEVSSFGLTVGRYPYGRSP